tara:strand:+ start:466 stop:732 length:267 start_codon:yes stop_codon:yes gene_type:complete
VREELQISSVEIIERYIESALKYVNGKIEDIPFRICSCFKNSTIPNSTDKRLINKGGSMWVGSPTCKVEISCKYGDPDWEMISRGKRG